MTYVFILWLILDSIFLHKRVDKLEKLVIVQNRLLQTSMMIMTIGNIPSTQKTAKNG